MKYSTGAIIILIITFFIIPTIGVICFILSIWGGPNIFRTGNIIVGAICCGWPLAIYIWYKIDTCHNQKKE